MTLYQCEICGNLATECVCDRCHAIMCQEFEDSEAQGNQERHVIDQYEACAVQGLQLDSNG